MSGETGEYLAWNLFLGPLLKLGTGDLETDTTDKMALFKVLLDSMTGDLLGRRGVYPIRCFASKHADTGIDVDCRINGADWERGRYDLYMHAESWQAETGFLAWKQYMLIVPVEAEDLESDSLRESLKNGLRKELQELQQAERQAQTEQQAASPEQKKKWWRFWD